MVSVDDLQVHYLGRFGDSNYPVFVSENGFIEIYVPEADGFLFYKNRDQIMGVDEFVVGSDRISQWSSCCRCEVVVSDFSNLDGVGLLQEEIVDDVETTPRSLREFLHQALFSSETNSDLGVSHAWVCVRCQSELEEILTEAYEERGDKIMSVLV